MKLLPILLLIAALIVCSIPLSSGVEAASGSGISVYEKMVVSLNDFELNHESLYGQWRTIYDPVFVSGHPAFPAKASTTSLYDTDCTEGTYSWAIELSWTNASVVKQVYYFDFDDFYPSLRHYLVQFDYKLDIQVDDTTDLTLGMKNEWYDSAGDHRAEMSSDGQWHTASFTPYISDDTNPDFYILMDVFQRYDTDHPYHSCNGTMTLHLDNMVAYAPACDVRFSFYNAYTGIGLDSNELIIQVWYDGVWTRVWNNEYRIAAGEHIGYKVTDYFGQTIAFVPDLALNHTAVYVDLPVKLVKVHITKPTWYTTDLPPTWWLTYSATGTEIPVEGWDLELIAGFYSFRWDAMTVDKGSDPLDDQDDLVVEEGSIGQYIDGNLSTGQSFTVSDFYLSMKPTYRSEATNGTINIIPSFQTWDGLAELVKQLVTEVTSNWTFRAITMTMGIGGLITFVSAQIYKGKRKAALKIQQQKENGGKR